MIVHVYAATKEETQELEHCTEHIGNFLNSDHFGGLFGRVQRLRYCERYSDLVSWHHYQDMLPPPTVPLRTHIARFSELIGFRPTYHAVRGSGGYRNAIWGLHGEYAGEPFDVVIYLSTRGLTIQAAGLTRQTHAAFFDWVSGKLLPTGFKSFRHWYEAHRKAE